MQLKYYSFFAHDLQISLATMLSLIYKIPLPPAFPILTISLFLTLLHFPALLLHSLYKNIIHIYLLWSMSALLLHICVSVYIYIEYAMNNNKWMKQKKILFLSFRISFMITLYFCNSRNGALWVLTGFAVCAIIPWCTRTGIGVQKVVARSTVFTWVTCTFIRVYQNRREGPFKCPLKVLRRSGPTNREILNWYLEIAQKVWIIE